MNLDQRKGIYDRTKSIAEDKLMYQADFDYLVTKVSVEYSSQKKKIIEKKSQINIKHD